MDIPARGARSGDSPPVVNYENPLPNRAATARRVLIATWCGAIPPLLLLNGPAFIGVMLLGLSIR